MLQFLPYIFICFTMDIYDFLASLQSLEPAFKTELRGSGIHKILYISIVPNFLGHIIEIELKLSLLAAVQQE